RRQLRAALDGWGEVVTLALALKDRPRGRVSPLEVAPGKPATTASYAYLCQIAADFLTLDGVRVVEEGRPHEAPDRIRATLHAGAALRDAPSVLEQRVRAVVRGVAVQQVERMLGAAEVDGDVLHRLADHFRAERQEDLLSAGLRGSRAMGHLFFE